MSCFIIPLAQAIATTAVRRHYGMSQKNGKPSSIWKDHLPSLEKMLWGGTIMLLVDHAINAELTMSLKEMLTIGLPMSAVVTGIWAAVILAKSVRKAMPR